MPLAAVPASGIAGKLPDNRRNENKYSGDGKDGGKNEAVFIKSKSVVDSPMKGTVKATRMRAGVQ